MNYPFYLGESLTELAKSRDAEALLHLVGRNFNVIMNAHGQSATLRKLRVAQFQATLTRAIYRAGAEPTRLFDLEMGYLERLSRVRVTARGELRNLLLEFSRHALQLIPAHPRSHPSLLQRFLDELPRPESGVREIARKLRVTPSHLCRAVKQATGRTPGEHLRHARLSRGLDLLERGSVADAARASGFSKASAFIAQFRKHFGETPGAYRRRLRGLPIPE